MAIHVPAKTPCTHTHKSRTAWLYAHPQKHPAHTHHTHHMAIRAPAKTPCTHTHTHITHTTWLYAHLQKHPAHTHTHHTPHGYTRTWKCTLNGMQADFTPTTISTVLWAYAACGYYDRVMCNTLGRRAALCFKDMSLFEVTQVRWKQEQLF